MSDPQIPDSYWRLGGCAEYALALHDAHPQLRFGRFVELFPEEAEDDYTPWTTNHVFCHDDRYAYGCRGRHELPFEDPDPAWAEHPENVTTEYEVAREDIASEWEIDAEMVSEARRSIAQSDPVAGDDDEESSERGAPAGLRERSGVKVIDAVIQRFLASDGGSVESFRVPEEAEEMCGTVSEELLSWCEAAELDAFVRCDTPDGHGYHDRSRNPAAGLHELVVVNHDGHAYSIDFTAAQYGYPALPLVQRADGELAPNAERDTIAEISWQRAW